MEDGDGKAPEELLDLTPTGSRVRANDFFSTDILVELKLKQILFVVHSFL